MVPGLNDAAHKFNKIPIFIGQTWFYLVKDESRTLVQNSSELFPAAEAEVIITANRITSFDFDKEN